MTKMKKNGVTKELRAGKAGGRVLWCLSFVLVFGS
jgi:hypothetical protein